VVLPQKTSQRQWLALLIGAALVLRLGAVLVTHSNHPQWALNGDSDSYIGAARSLVEHGKLTIRPGSNTPILFRTPGYPVFIAAVYAVFGQRLVPVSSCRRCSVSGRCSSFDRCLAVWDDTSVCRGDDPDVRSVPDPPQTGSPTSSITAPAVGRGRSRLSRSARRSGRGSGRCSGCASASRR
jgi:hypothetical protein